MAQASAALCGRRALPRTARTVMLIRPLTIPLTEETNMTTKSAYERLAREVVELKSRQDHVLARAHFLMVMLAALCARSEEPLETLLADCDEITGFLSSTESPAYAAKVSDVAREFREQAKTARKRFQEMQT
jgi:hypothetical protein